MRKLLLLSLVLLTPPAGNRGPHDADFASWGGSSSTLYASQTAPAANPLAAEVVMKKMGDAQPNEEITRREFCNGLL